MGTGQKHRESRKNRMAGAEATRTAVEEESGNTSRVDMLCKGTIHPSGHLMKRGILTSIAKISSSRRLSRLLGSWDLGDRNGKGKSEHM